MQGAQQYYRSGEWRADLLVQISGAPALFKCQKFPVNIQVNKANKSNPIYNDFKVALSYPSAAVMQICVLGINSLRFNIFGYIYFNFLKLCESDTTLISDPLIHTVPKANSCLAQHKNYKQVKTTCTSYKKSTVLRQIQASGSVLPTSSLYANLR